MKKILFSLNKTLFGRWVLILLFGAIFAMFISAGYLLISINDYRVYGNVLDECHEIEDVIINTRYDLQNDYLEWGRKCDHANERSLAKMLYDNYQDSQSSAANTFSFAVLVTFVGGLSYLIRWLVGGKL